MEISRVLSRRAVAAVAALSIVLTFSAPALAAGPKPPKSLTPPSGLTATVGDRSVELAWTAPAPSGLADPGIEVERDGSAIATLPASATSYSDADVATSEEHTYTVTSFGTRGNRRFFSAPSAPASVKLPEYLVGAAARDITPDGIVNLGGNGLGDGSVIPPQVITGGRGAANGERIGARAIVISDGDETIAIADIETQGMFAAYQDGDYGLSDIAAQVAADVPGLPVDHILIASDHTHSGPDTIGAWGGPPDGYLEYIKQQTVAAIEDAFFGRRFATLTVGHSDASDLIYNQACSEALNQSKEPAYPGPEVCGTPGKDGDMRVLQATAPSGDVIVTYMAFAAHATLGGGSGLHGDWPQFLSETMADGFTRTVDGTTYSVEGFGGMGLAMEGAVGGTQPCRPACGFTDRNNPGYNVSDRRTAYTLNYMAHVHDALSNETTHDVHGPVAAAQSFIREPVANPFVLALFTGGNKIGAKLLRSHESPWVVGETIRSIASALRVGDVLFAGTPGEGFWAIGNGVRQAVTDESEVFQLGLANDQLGYLIAPVRYVPIIAAEAPVNDNIIFNVSPTIGDHVMCTDIRLALTLGFAGDSPTECAGYDAQDSLDDPLGGVPLGGLVLPD